MAWWCALMTSAAQHRVVVRRLWGDGLMASRKPLLPGVWCGLLCLAYLSPALELVPLCRLAHLTHLTHLTHLN